MNKLCQTIYSVIKMKKLIIISALCLAFILPILGCQSSESKTYTVKAADISRKVICYGTVECDKTVKADLPEYSRNVVFNFSAGDTVHNGDVLATYYLGSKQYSLTCEADGIITDIDGRTIEYCDIASTKISAKISEADAAFIKTGMTVKITGSGFDKQYYSGSVTKVYSIAEQTASGVFIQCDISVNDPDRSMIPGFSARAEIDTQVSDSVLVPVNSLLYDGDFYIYKYTDGKAARIKVRETAVYGDMCAVSGEIKSGDIIYLNARDANGEQ